MSAFLDRLGVTLLERGLLPDFILRLGCRQLLSRRLVEESSSCEGEQERLQQLVQEWSRGPVAEVPEKANEQHYELPPEFFEICLGMHRKYSGCLWSEGVSTLDEAEAAALAETCRRAELADGQHILELGCGWGSLSLWMAEHFPRARITSVSNSAPQRRFIEAEAEQRGLTNLRVITCDMNEFDPASFVITEPFDRVVSVEMFEHMRNYRELLRRISTWLKPGGKLFIHVFCHARLAYPFEAAGEDDFMARHFFTGGVMPSDDLFLHFQEHLRVVRRWRWGGSHYEKTANAWLANLDADLDRALPILAEVYGERNKLLWLRRWRVFFIACAELWGYRRGQEWWIAHTLFEKSPVAGDPDSDSSMDAVMPATVSQLHERMTHMNERILVTGATGYIGGRLVPRLLHAGYSVRCLVRTPRKLESRDWVQDPRVEVVQSDIAGDENLAAALEGCSAAYYLIHSMVVAGGDYAERDRELASAFATAAQAAGVDRIVYLGGLGETGADLSEHLRSRREVEQVLASTGVPVTVLRAAMIIGSGSASFEVLRYLVERLPIMVTPRWVSTPCQPIAVDNVLHYLLECLSVPETAGRVLDIGAPEVLNYREIMHAMAECLGLRRRWILPVPVLTPRLSSWWIHLVTPISSDIARPLAEGLRNPVVCRDNEAVRLMPQKLLSVREAMTLALQRERDRDVETIWSAAGTVPGDAAWAGGRTFDYTRSIDIDATPVQVFDTISKVGGRHGWYAAGGFWKLRGWMDRLIGGPGLGRGRRHPERLAFGEAVDFWRVAECTPPRSLRLLAEMKLPGTAMLELEVEPLDDGRRTRLTQTARFEPRGLLGVAYWYAVCPFHGLVFPRMLTAMARDASGSSVPSRKS